MVDVDELLSTRTVAERLGVSGVHFVHYCLRTDATLPQPVYVVPDMARPLRLWCWPDIEARWRSRSPDIRAARHAASPDRDLPSRSESWQPF